MNNVQQFYSKISFSEVCRACLSKRENMTPILYKSSKNITIFDMIIACTSISVSLK